MTKKKPPEGGFFHAQTFLVLYELDIDTHEVFEVL